VPKHKSKEICDSSDSISDNEYMMTMMRRNEYRTIKYNFDR
jgi:hypothetical protein